MAHNRTYGLLRTDRDRIRRSQRRARPGLSVNLTRFPNRERERSWLLVPVRGYATKGPPAGQ